MAGFGQATLAVVTRAAGHPGNMPSAMLRFWASPRRHQRPRDLPRIADSIGIKIRLVAT
jgi:hypothetical protein